MSSSTIAWSDEPSLAELDALVAQSLPAGTSRADSGGEGGGALTLEELEDQFARPTARATSAREDQATGLRGLVEQGGTQANVQRSRRDEAPNFSRVQSHRAKVVVVASGKGGVGKTTIAVNLSVAMARRGVRVTLLDADFGTANADVLCGVTPKGRLEHVFMPGAGGAKWGDGAPASIRDIAVNAPGGFRLIPGSTGVSRMADMSASDRKAIVDALSELDQDTDVLVVDAGAGVGQSVTTFMHGADTTIVVATPEPTSIADAYALIKCGVSGYGGEALLKGSGRVALVLNQVIDGSEAARVHARIRAVCDRFLGLDCPLLGSIAQDVRVAQAVRSREPLLVRPGPSVAGEQIAELSAAVLKHVGVRGIAAVSGGVSSGGEGVRGLVRRLLGMQPVLGPR